MVKTLNAIFLSSLVILVLMLGFTFADSNGIWNYAKDLRPGTFGSDEGNSSPYIFTNPLEADNFDVNIVTANSISSAYILAPTIDSVNIVASTIDSVNIDTTNLNASRIDSVEIYKNGNDIATLDAMGKVPLEQLPFHKGDLISPADRPLISGLGGYTTNYFSIANLGISGNFASNVREGVSFGPGNSMSGTLDDDVICTSAGGNANCGVTSVMSPGIFYSIIGANSAYETNFCTRVNVGTDGSISSTNIVTAGTCTYVNSCDSASQTWAYYSDGTSCGTNKICNAGSCILNTCSGSYSFKIHNTLSCRKGRTTSDQSLSFTISNLPSGNVNNYVLKTDVAVRKQSYCGTAYCPLTVMCDSSGTLIPSLPTSSCGSTVRPTTTLIKSFPAKYYASGSDKNGWYNTALYQN